MALSGGTQFEDNTGADWVLKWSVAPAEETIDDPCKEPIGSVIGCENQSLGEAVEVAGTPFALHYQSDRMAGRSFTNSAALAHARELGGWTLSVHHRYDPATNALYLGGGDRRDAVALGKTVKTTTGHFLVGSSDAYEVYEFDAAGRHLKTRHALTGAALYTFSYDAQKRLSGVTDGNGNLTKVQRDAAGRPAAIVGPYGQTTRLAVDSRGYLASITNPAGEAVRLQSSTTGLLTRYTSPKGAASSFIWDGDGRLLRDTDAAGGFQTLSRTESGDLGIAFTVKLKTALNRTSQYQVTPAAGGSTARVIADPAGLKTSRSRTANGTETMTWPNGMKTSSTPGEDPRFGRSAAFAASSTVATPGGLKLARAATRKATLSNSTDPFSLAALTETLAVNGRPYASVFNRASLAQTNTTPVGRKSQSFINAQGRVVKSSITGLSPVVRTYDARGRLATIGQGDGTNARTTRFSYGGDGFLKDLTDPLGRVQSFKRDAAGRILQETLPGGRAITYAYDAEGNVTAVTPPGRPAHRFDYTSVGLLSAYTAPKVGTEANQTRYSYNLDQQLTGISYPDGKTVAYAYDAAGRLKTLSFGRGTLAYAYDAKTGNLKSVSAPGGIGLAYAYDGALPTATAWTGPVAGSVQRAYDNDFRVKQLKVNGADPVGFTFDKDGLLTGAGALALARNAQNGLLTGSTVGNVTDKTTYDGFAEPLSYQASFLGSPIYTNSYTYDRLGRIATRTETIGGATGKYVYTYDTAGRLAKVAKNGATLSTYVYDGNGNRLSFTRPSGKMAGVYDAQDRLTRYGTAVYAYTANGELASKTDGGRKTLYNYDALGNLASVTLPGGGTITYLIDGQNRRIGKKINGVLTQGFLYQDRLKPIAELDGQGHVVSRFVYATRANVPDYLIKGSQRYRIITDHLGSPRLVVNTADGTIAQRMDYDEFGNVTRDTRPGFQPFGFAGGLYDRDTKLVRFGARDYDAETGRWTVKDPMLFVESVGNLYVYANNNPGNLVDHDGTEPSWNDLADKYDIEIDFGDPTTWQKTKDEIEVIVKKEKVEDPELQQNREQFCRQLLQKQTTPPKPKPKPKPKKQSKPKSQTWNCKNWDPKYNTQVLFLCDGL